MNQLNSLILEGNLVRDAVLLEPSPGFKKCVFTVGVNRFYKNKNNEDVNEVSFFDIEGYGKIAEYCEQKGKKGRGVRVVGRLKQDVWKNTEGKSNSRIYVVAEHIEYKPAKKIPEDQETSETGKNSFSPEQKGLKPASQLQAKLQPQKEKVLVEEEAVF
ncbi:MAG: single-stranded DNA-binding protein [Treponema sp.]|nr:single-stranded DNA-binding protein [Treponema sp.]